MKPYEKLAVEFATALVKEQFDEAHRLLSGALQKKFSPAALKKKLHAMFSGYAEGPARRVALQAEVSMEDWPARKENDVGWAYVGIEGDDFVEAVTITVSKAKNDLVIRDIEWGRP